MTINYYKKSSSNISYFPSGTAQTEPNIREEFINTIEGSFPEVAKGHYIILRKADRDSNGNTIPCQCVDLITKEGDKDRFCPICCNGGILFTEEYIKAYGVLAGIPQSNAVSANAMPFGTSDLQYRIFYTMYDTVYTIDDRLIEIELDNSGAVVEPVNRLQIYKIIRPYGYRLDNGKLEYWKIFTYQEDVKWINPPTSF